MNLVWELGTQSWKLTNFLVLSFQENQSFENRNAQPATSGARTPGSSGTNQTFPTTDLSRLQCFFTLFLKNVKNFVIKFRLSVLMLICFAWPAADGKLCYFPVSFHFFACFWSDFCGLWAKIFHVLKKLHLNVKKHCAEPDSARHCVHDHCELDQCTVISISIRLNK